MNNGARYKPYPRYKDSGVEAFGQIPALWDVRPVRAHFRLGRGRVISHEEIHENPGKYPVYSSQTEGEGVMGFISSFAFDGAYLTWTTDGANAGTVFRRNGQFNCTNVCGTLKPSQPDSIDLSFANFALNLATGFFVRHDINPKLMNGVMAGIRFPVPSKKEQRAIAEFLDRETAKIDELIAKKERLIELLEEKRAAFITHAVTRGLNPDAPLRDSGIEWLGQIPTHWEVRRLKFVARVQGGYAFKSEVFQTVGTPVVRMANLRRGSLDLEDAMCIAEGEALRDFALEEGDLILGLSGSLGATGSLGNFSVVRKENLPCQLNQRVGRFRIRKAQITTEYLTYLLASRPFTEPLVANSTGTAQFNISPEEIGDIVIPVPHGDEQKVIAAELRTASEESTRIVTAITKAIESLQEYRAALITAAVTGKIDVRDEVNAAA